MRIIGHVVARNESGRFLDSCLGWNSQWLDGLHVFDDRSEDDTLPVALKHTEMIGVRPEQDVAFIENESAFRQSAWENLSEVAELTEDDWIFAFDADEFLVGNNEQNPREALESTISFVEASSKLAARIKRVEVWELGAFPLIRVDGFWSRESQPRLVKWNPKAKAFQKGALGCGSLPQYAYKSLVSNVTFCTILDYGYSIEGEAQRKYELYKQCSGDKHNQSHIESIVQTPKLTEWRGPVPKVV